MLPVVLIADHRVVILRVRLRTKTSAVSIDDRETER
jgi:hypothetical protein